MDLIQCRDCGAQKLASEFHVCKQYKHGRDYYCRDCRRQRSQISTNNNSFMIAQHRKEGFVNFFKPGARKVVQKITIQEWRVILEEYGHQCPRCGHVGKLTIDHIVPVDLGEQNTIDNIQPLCGKCNAGKRDRNTIRYQPFNKGSHVEQS